MSDTTLDNLSAFDNFTAFLQDDDDDIETKFIDPSHTEKNISNEFVENLVLGKTESSVELITSLEKQLEIANAKRQLEDYENQLKKLQQGQTLKALNTAQTMASFYRFNENLAKRYTLNDFYKDLPNISKDINSGYINKKKVFFLGLSGQMPFSFDRLFFLCSSNQFLEYLRNDYMNRYLSPENVNEETLSGALNENKISSLAQSKQYIEHMAFYVLSFVLNNQFNQKRQLRVQKWFQSIESIITPPESKDTRIPDNIRRALRLIVVIRNTVGRITTDGLELRNRIIENNPDLSSKLKIHTSNNFTPYYEVMRFYKTVNGKYPNQVDFSKGYLLVTAYYVLLEGFYNAGFELNYSLDTLELLNELLALTYTNKDLSESFIQSVFDSHRHHYQPDLLWVDN